MRVLLFGDLFGDLFGVSRVMNKDGSLGWQKEA